MLPLRDKEIIRRDKKMIKREERKKMYRSYVNKIELPLLICNQNKGSSRKENSISVQL